jgi:hypothetical protein
VYKGLKGTELGGDFFLHTKMSDEQRHELEQRHAASRLRVAYWARQKLSHDGGS